MTLKSKLQPTKTTILSEQIITKTVAAVTSNMLIVSVCQFDIIRLQAKVKEMEDTLQVNQQTIDEIKNVLHYLAENKEHIDWKRLYRLIGSAERLTDTRLSGIVNMVMNNTVNTLPKQMVSIAPEYCRFSESAPSKTDIQASIGSYFR